MSIIRKKIERELIFVAYGLFRRWFALYRVSRHVILQFGVILGKLNKTTTAYKNKLKKRIFQEYYSTSSSSSLDDVELSNWSSTKHILPQEIMELILQRLPLNDYLRFGTVCRSWRFIIAKMIAEKRCTPAPELPLLILCSHPYTNRYNSFVSLDHDMSSSNSNNQVLYKPNCPELHSRNIAGSVEGWLIMIDCVKWRPEGFIRDFWYEKAKNFFLNPVSGARVVLPSQTTVCVRYGNRSEPQFIGKVVASAIPTSPNCIVAALCHHGTELAFCRPADNSWTLYKDDGQIIYTDAIFADDGKLYAITLEAWKSITVFDLREFSQGCTSLIMAKLLVILPAPWPLVDCRRMRVKGHTICIYDWQMCYLVKKDHDLLMIMRFSDFAFDEECVQKPIAFDYTIPQRIKTFKVFKLDKSGPRWVHVPSIGDDKILFLSQKNCMIMSAAAVGVNRKHLKKEEQITGNCIYFAFDYMCTISPQEGRKVGVFSLVDGSIKRHIPSVPHSWFTLPPLWFTPNPW